MQWGQQRKLNGSKETKNANESHVWGWDLYSFSFNFFFSSSPKYSLMNIYHLLIQDLSTVSLLHTKDYARGYGYSGEQDNPYPQGA